MAKNFQLSCAPAAVLVVFLMVLPLISAHNKTSPPLPAPHSNEDFFFKSCSVTPYPNFCIEALPSYTIEIKQNPFRLAMYAVRISKMTAEASVILFAQIDVEIKLLAGLFPSTETQNLLSVLEDCSSLYKAAVELKFRALRQMGKLNTPSSSSDCRVEMSNVQTWLSDALTNEEKCIDKLGSLYSVRIENMMKSKDAVENATHERKITCNALALVKDFLAHH